MNWVGRFFFKLCTLSRSTATFRDHDQMIFLIFEQNQCSLPLSREARAAAVERMRVGGRARRRVLLALALAPAGPRAVAVGVAVVAAVAVRLQL